MVIVEEAWRMEGQHPLQFVNFVNLRKIALVDSTLDLYAVNVPKYVPKSGCPMGQWVAESSHNSDWLVGSVAQ